MQKFTPRVIDPPEFFCSAGFSGNQLFRLQQESYALRRQSNRSMSSGEEGYERRFERECF